MTQHAAEASFAPHRSMPASEPQNSNLYSRSFKRLLDLVIALAAMPVALPLILIAAALAASDGHSPIFRQARIGRGGRRFTILKIRTMVPDAEACLSRHIADDPVAAAEWAETQKLRRDPRITRFGGFLRRTSLDELPQLFNVIIGDMSLVGPRPMMPQQRAIYPGRAYESLRPGITGLWQIAARNASSFADRATYDTEYAREISLVTDLRILGRTAVALIRQTGC